MKNLLNKLFAKSTVFYIFILKPLYDIGIANFTSTQNIKYMNNWLDPTIQIIIILLLVFVSKKFTALNFKMNVLNDILKLRYRQTYLDGIFDDNIKNLNNMYFGALIGERKMVLRVLKKKYKYRAKEIDEIIDEIYPELKKIEK